MGQYQRLLLIADPAMRDSAALQRASALAEASGAALHIAAFVEPSGSFALLDKSAREQVREGYLQDCREWLVGVAALLRSKGITVTSEVVSTSDTLKDILQYVAEMQPDLLIKDVQHESALKRAFITPLDGHLLRECPVPVHLLGPSHHALPRMVIAAVDPSRLAGEGLNQRIIQAANGLALQCNAELHLVHCYDLSAAFLADAGVGGVGWSNLDGHACDAQEQSFVALAEHYGVPTERRHFIIGAPITQLSDFARHLDADVLVMGTVQRKGLNKLIGSTTEHILFQAPCSILAVMD